MLQLCLIVFPIPRKMDNTTAWEVCKEEPKRNEIVIQKGHRIKDIIRFNQNLISDILSINEDRKFIVTKKWVRESKQLLLHSYDFPDNEYNSQN